MEKWASSLLVSPFFHEISHRMDIRCFLSGLPGKKMPSPLNSYHIYIREEGEKKNGKSSNHGRDYVKIIYPE